jgi:hypothetical protein
MSKCWRVLGLLMAILWLHALSVVPLLYDSSRWPEQLRAVQPDLLWLLLVAVIGSAARRPKLAAHVAAAALWLTLLLRLAIVIVRTNFQRGFELTDLQLVGGLYHALTNALSLLQCWLGGAAALLVAALLHWLTARAFRVVAKTAQCELPAAIWITSLQVAVVLAATWPAMPLHNSVLVRLVDSVVSAARDWLSPESVLAPIEARVAAGTKRMAQVPCGLEHLVGVDVHVLVLESYGRLVFRHPQLRSSVQALFAELQAPLARAGFAARTGACAPAIAGGLSGLAHAELLTGVIVPDERTRTVLLNSSLIALPQRFRQAGYHTAEVQPAMHRAWPEGEAFYGIEESIWQQQLAYQGKPYAFGKMPDQYSLHYLLDHVVRPATQPVFTMFVGVSGHAPWSSIPPFVADWSFHEQLFAEGPADSYAVGYATMHSDPVAVTAYGDAITYSLRAAADFVCHLQRPSMVIVLGDHQPPIAGAVQPADRTHEVPVHVFSNRPELLSRLHALDYVVGLDLPETVAAIPMADVAPALLRLFSK